jgi:DNA-binding XRE family transcriptional regulator
MKHNNFVTEHELATLAKAARQKADLSKAEVARLLRVTRGTIHQAEEYPDMSLTKLRVKIIEKCSPTKVSGPFYRIELS